MADIEEGHCVATTKEELEEGGEGGRGKGGRGRGGQKGDCKLRAYSTRFN